MKFIFQDIRYAFRTLRKELIFTIVSIACLAFGIAGPLTFFAVMQSALSRSLPVAQPEQLYFVSGLNTIDKTQRSQLLSYLNYVDFRDQNDVFSDVISEAEMAAYFKNDDGSNQGKRVSSAVVSGNYFSGLGVKPLIGRAFLPEEDKTPGTHPVVILSHNLWQNGFGSDPNITGKTVMLNQTTFNIIGVAPKDFHGLRWGSAYDLWIPSMMAPQLMTVAEEREVLFSRRSNAWLYVIGRLRPGVSFEQADLRMKSIAGGLAQAYPDANEGFSVTLTPINELTADVKRDVLVVVGAGTALLAIVLLIISANVGSLLLAHAASRQTEIGIRLALGATPSRIILQLLIESIVLASLGSAAGLTLTYWLLSLVSNSGLLPPGLRGGDLSISLSVLGFALLLAFLTGLAFGLVPALQASKTDVLTTIRGESNLLGTSNRRLRLGDVLIVCEVALAMLTLTCASLFIHSVQSSLSGERGYDIDKQLVISLNASGLGYTGERGKEFYQQLAEQVGTSPGIEAVTLSTNLPVGLGLTSVEAEIQGGNTRSIYVNVVSPNHFKVTGMRLLRGRDFTVQDVLGGEPIAIVNETFARQWFPNQDPLGQRFNYRSPNPSKQDEWSGASVVGVVRDIKEGLTNEQSRPSIYLPFAQEYVNGQPATLIVRTKSDAPAAMRSTREALLAVNKDIPVADMVSLRELKESTLWPVKTAGFFTAGLGLLALCLTAIGIYGTTAYLVNLRTKEIGIRMALGAQPRDVLRLVAGQGTKLTLIGLGIGIILTIILTRILFSLIFGLGAVAVITFISVPLLMLGVVLVASYFPVRRIARMEPAEALREEKG